MLKAHEKLMLSYNVLKYYIVLLRNFKASLNANSLNNLHPGLKWADYIKTDEFRSFAEEVNTDLRN